MEIVPAKVDTAFIQPAKSAEQGHAKSDTAARVRAELTANDKDHTAAPSRTDIEYISKELNKFMQYLNADIQFQLHEKTKQLIVQVVDIKEQKVLREFPPHELLDTLANIRDYVGAILDKRV